MISAGVEDRLERGVELEPAVEVASPDGPVSVPRITEQSIAASRITRRVVVEITIAASLARRGAWRIGPGGPIFWRARA